VLLHPEIAAAVHHQLVDLVERAGIEEEIDALARRQLARGMLPVEPVLPAAQFGEDFQLREGLERIGQAFTACTFSQSFRNFSRPMVVSGWLNI
jgi:hypothetical protein